MASWSFLTNHGLVLTYIGRFPDSTGIAIAQAVGITERAARNIVADLLAEAYIEREKVGRRNRYRLNASMPLPHPGARTVTVGELLGLLWSNYDPAESAGGASSRAGAQREAGSSEAAEGRLPRPPRNE
ncbi:MAG: transcriptional regulator [Chloroflexota bacterium]